MTFALSEADRRLGLKTSVALQKLSEEVDAVRRSSFRPWRPSLVSVQRHPPIALSHIVANLVVWTLLLAAVALSKQPEDFLSRDATIVVLIVMLLLIGINVAGALFIDRLSHNGVNRKILRLCSDLAEYSRSVTWPASAYMDLNAPAVSTIHCHWTVRDGQLVNLPAILLVRDDLIFVRPGATFSVHCTELKEGDLTASVGLSFGPDERYLPVLHEPGRAPTRPMTHQVLRPIRCRVKLTPAVDFVRDFLNLHIRGQSDLDALFARGCRAALVCIIVVFAVCLVAALAKRRLIGVETASTAYVLAFPCLAALPILLLSGPPMWHALNLWELAQALVYVHRTTLVCEDWRQPERQPSMDSLTESIGSLSDLENREAAGWSDVLAKLKYLLTDSVEVDWKLVHSFGTMSRLCCADKEGILSLPIPLPDKVCVLRRKHRHRVTPAHRKKSDISLQPSGGTSDAITLLDTEAHVQVLDISHDPKIAYKLDFDDQHWRRCAKSLKPLGLAILLNNCHPSVRPRYDAFAHHVTAVTLSDDPQASGVNKRRCLCDLARLVGFTDGALDSFSLQFTLGTYQQASKEDQAKDQFLRMLSALKQKAPVGHTFGCAVQQKHLGGQYFVQGSADMLVSELCTEYWNGSSVAPLTELDRKRLLSFYSRHSYSSYCDAFSYTPVLSKMSREASERCIELPPFHFSAEEAEDPPTPQLGGKPLSRTFSVETTLNRSSNLSLTDIDACLNLQSGQVFLGMVASQFQANSDVVRLIDQLELGCIRFVYFSEENELRSRGFAERLGLESGWNCHISLRSSDSCVGSRTTVTGADKDLQQMQQQQQSVALAAAIPGTARGNLSQWGSAPALLNTDTNRVTFKGEPEELVFSPHESDSASRGSSDDGDSESEDVGRSAVSSRDDNQSGASTPSNQRADASREDSDVLYVDQNKSRLPRGIAEIRPHLQKVDNVPLQVSLFTDCDIGAVSDMLLIMRQYGERSILLYSSLSLRSCRLAKITDTAIALMPQLPPTCRSEPVPDIGSRSDPSPAFVASRLLSLPAGYAPSRLSLAGLIADCRCSVERLKRPLRAFLSMALMLSALQAACGLLLLPPCLSAGQVAALSFGLLPAIAFGTVAKAEDPMRALNQPARRRDLPRRKALTVRYLSLHVALTLPSAVVATLVCAGFVYFLCSERQSPAFVTALPGSNHSLHGAALSGGNNETWRPTGLIENVTACLAHPMWTQGRDYQLLAAFQCILFCFVVLACFLTSLVFVTENQRSFQVSGAKRLKTWCLYQLVVLSFGLAYACVDLSLRSEWMRLREIGPHVWLPLAAWLLAMGPVNEIVKHRQRRIKTKEDRAARLHFDTKLGMYSPV